MVFQFLRSLVSLIEVSQSNGKNAPGDSSDYSVFRIHPVAEEITEILCKGVNGKPSGQVVFDDGEPICESECYLGDGIGPGFSNVVAGDTDAVEIPDIVFGILLLEQNLYPSL